MGTPEYIVSAGLEFFFALISIILLIGCLLDHERKRRTNMIMIVILAIHAAMNAMDACVWIWCDVPEWLLVMKIFCFLSYAFGCVIMTLFSYLLVITIREATPVWAWVDRALIIITAVMMMLWFWSLFNGMYYYWDEDGICQIGELFWISQAFGVVIFLFDIFLVLHHRKKLKRKDTVVLTLYSLIPLLSFSLVHIWDVTPVYMATTIVLLLYYIVLHAEHGQRIAEQETLLVKQELELTNSRTVIMLSQIRPHFLYNSLTAIAQLCEKDPKKAKETTLKFSSYLRQNMNSLDRTEPISFQAELEHVKNYLAIEQVRFGSDLCIVYHIDATDFLIPPLSLQPIVENAVKHGVGMKEDGGSVSITSSETSDGYEVTVTDDGVGFDSSKPPADGKDHFGMRLVGVRLQKLVGGSMHIESQPGMGTTVTLFIPKEKI